MCPSTLATAILTWNKELNGKRKTESRRRLPQSTGWVVRLRPLLRGEATSLSRRLAQYHSYSPHCIFRLIEVLYFTVYLVVNRVVTFVESSSPLAFSGLLQ